MNIFMSSGPCSIGWSMIALEDGEARTSKREKIMKPRNIALMIFLLLLSCFAFSLSAQADTPVPFHAQLIPPPDGDRIIGNLEMVLAPAIGNPDVFQAYGQVELNPPPDTDMPYTFGEIVRYDGTVVIGFGDPLRRGTRTYFIINAVVPADLANEMILTPNSFSVQVFNGGVEPAAIGTLQFGPGIPKRR